MRRGMCEGVRSSAAVAHRAGSELTISGMRRRQRTRLLWLSCGLVLGVRRRDHVSSDTVWSDGSWWSWRLEAQGTLSKSSSLQRWELNTFENGQQIKLGLFQLTRQGFCRADETFCKGKEPGYYADISTDCRSYLLCFNSANTRGLQFNCPPGLGYLVTDC